MRVLNIVGRHVVVFIFALAVAALLNMLSSRDRFIELSIATSIICLAILHFRWLFGFKRPV